MCLKKEKMNERKESERCPSFEALVCFFCGFSRDASLDVWMKFRLITHTNIPLCFYTFSTQVKSALSILPHVQHIHAENCN